MVSCPSFYLLHQYLCIVLRFQLLCFGKVRLRCCYQDSAPPPRSALAHFRVLTATYLLSKNMSRSIIQSLLKLSPRYKEGHTVAALRKIIICFRGFRVNSTLELSANFHVFYLKYFIILFLSQYHLQV